MSEANLRNPLLMRSIQAPKQDMLTINYFGNIQDTLIGQIKTKIPMIKKFSEARKFSSPIAGSFSNTFIDSRKLSVT